MLVPFKALQDGPDIHCCGEQGMKNAVPKTILRMMNVEGMTRENVASHLQKYRLHLKQRASQPGAVLCAAEQQTGPAGLSAHPTAPVVTVTGFPTLAADVLDGEASIRPVSQLLPYLLHHGIGTHCFLYISPSSISGAAALGMPVSHSYVSLCSVSGPTPLSYIPPQAWAAGVPGYDALQGMLTHETLCVHACYTESQM